MRKKNYNEDYFEQIDTEDKAYFLGFIPKPTCFLREKKLYLMK